ncbi:hypothetical protein E2C01_049211 [Portunus trituberculatus]|uniref:Uncharacterized protein n=1 Tax=Portunus trituberculatus TaxID=210409 RepID=A0A5B7GC94_PORTR|nr:hypothetical protein [Portunus trituberculatus]
MNICVRRHGRGIRTRGGANFLPDQSSFKSFLTSRDVLASNWQMQDYNSTLGFGIFYDAFTVGQSAAEDKVRRA